MHFTVDACRMFCLRQITRPHVVGRLIGRGRITNQPISRKKYRNSSWSIVHSILCALRLRERLAFQHDGLTLSTLRRVSLLAVVYPGFGQQMYLQVRYVDAQSNHLANTKAAVVNFNRSKARKNETSKQRNCLVVTNQIVVQLAHKLTATITVFSTTYLTPRHRM